MSLGHRNWPVLVMGILWTVFSSIFVGVGLMTMWNGFSGGSWQKTPCVIERFEISPKPGDSRRFVPQLDFRYEFGGRSYSSHRLWRKKNDSASYEDLSEIRQAFLQGPGEPRPTPAGAVTECWVNPARPQEACLLKQDPERIWGGLFFAVFGGFFVAIGVAMILEKPATTRLRNRGFAEGSIPYIFVLMFGSAGLVLLVTAIVKRDSHGLFSLALSLPLSLPCLAFGIGGMWALLKRRRRRRKKRERELKRNMSRTQRLR